MKLLVGLLACALLGVSAADGLASPRQVVPAQARKRQPGEKPASKPKASAAWHARHGLFYQRNWGVDIIGIRPVASGYMLRFDYRVLDPARAAPLNDHKLKPYVIDEATRTALAVPAMENVGELRQVAPPQVNRIYFILFGNPGRLVKPGNRVTLVVGELRIEGLIVD